MERNIPVFGSRLRNNIVTVPEVISRCSGIRVFGQSIKSFLFSTDVAIIRNTNALILAADKPIFCGVGGGITTGARSLELAIHAEFQGALGWY